MLNTKNRARVCALRRILCPLLGVVLLVALRTFSSAYDQVKIDKVSLLPKAQGAGRLAADREGRLWMLDGSGQRVHRFDDDGKADLTLSGGKGAPFGRADDVCFAPGGELVLLDRRGEVVVVERPASTGAAQALETVRRFPVPKSVALAVAADGFVFVGTKRNEVIVYAADGIRLHTLLPDPAGAFKTITALAVAPDGHLWALDGARGFLHRFSSDRRWLSVTEGLEKATGITVDPFGFVYAVLDAGQLVEIQPDGSIAGRFGTRGREPGRFRKPVGVAWAGGRVWVAEAGNRRLQSFEVINKDKTAPLAFEPSGWVQMRQVATSPLGGDQCLLTDEGELVLLDFRRGVQTWVDTKDDVVQSTTLPRGGDTGLRGADHAALDGNGTLWVVDNKSGSVANVDRDGNVLSLWSARGRQTGALRRPTVIAERDAESLLVVDAGGGRCQVFNKQGMFLFAVGAAGRQPGHIRSVDGVAVAPNTIALIDNKRKALLIFDHLGRFEREVANMPGGVAVWEDLSAIAADEHGHLFVMDGKAGRIRVFDRAGTFLADLHVSGRSLSSVREGRFAILDRDVRTFAFEFVPRPVVGLSARPVEGDVVLTWRERPYAATYRIDKATTGAFVPVAEVAAPPFNDRAVIPGASYRYAVRGVTPSGHPGGSAVTQPVRAGARENISPVSIGQVAFDPIFPAALKRYVTDPIGIVQVVNNTNRIFRNVKVSMSVKRYTDFPTEVVLPRLGPGDEVDVPVTLTLNDTVLELTENTPVQADVRLSFFEETGERTVTQNAPLMLYARNAMSWTDKARLSAFVTPRDPPVTQFSREAIRGFLAPLKNSTVGKPLAKAALFYESLAALGLSYVSDPNTPFAEVSGKPEVLDYVQFPRDTLAQRTGDCDDTTALLSALLESIGVQTAFVDTPGHIFLMANLEESDPAIIGLPEERFVEFQGTLWVPMETTRFSQGFLDAWQTAINQVRKAEADGAVEFLPLLAASEKYPPVTLREAPAHEVVYPLEAVQTRFPAVLAQMEEERYALARESALAALKAAPDDPMAAIALGIVHIEGRAPEEGKKIFLDVAASTAPAVRAAALNNLGNLAYLEQDFEEAVARYTEASELDPEDGGVLVNLARAHWRAGRRAEARRHLKAAQALLPDWAEYAADLPRELLR